jgi:hypothetical protein
VSELIPVGPGVPQAVAAILKSHEDAIRELQNPTQPRPLWVHPTAATLEATAPAANFPGQHAIADDINSVVVSTPVAGSYAWRRADGSAL